MRLALVIRPRTILIGLIVLVLLLVGVGMWRVHLALQPLHAAAGTDEAAAWFDRVLGFPPPPEAANLAFCADRVTRDPTFAFTFDCDSQEAVDALIEQMSLEEHWEDPAFQRAEFMEMGLDKYTSLEGHCPWWQRVAAMPERAPAIHRYHRHDASEQRYLELFHDVTSGQMTVFVMEH